jgi:hypothetical protein
LVAFPAFPEYYWQTGRLNGKEFVFRLLPSQFRSRPKTTSAPHRTTSSPMRFAAMPFVAMSFPHPSRSHAFGPLTLAVLLLAVTTQLPAQSSTGPTNPSATAPGSSNALPGKASPSTTDQAVTESSDSTDSIAVSTAPIRITLSPSETPIKLGSTSNIAATLQNVSPKPISVDLQSLQLISHSVVAANPSKCVVPLTATFNTANGSTNGRWFLTLQPSDQMTVHFNLSAKPIEVNPKDSAISPELHKQIQNWRDSCQTSWWDNLKNKLDFSPGNYDYYLTGFYWVIAAPDPSASLQTEVKSGQKTAPNPPSYRPWTQRSIAVKATFPVSIDQTSIIIFAIIGGLLALLVVTFTGAQADDSLMTRFNAVSVESTGWTALFQRITSSEGFHVIVHFFARVIGVAILCASFTIVSSRLSDTQLPVKITILDAWGAMTIGFVAFFIGQKFIASLANWGGSSDPGSSPDPNRAAKPTTPAQGPDTDSTPNQ